MNLADKLVGTHLVRNPEDERRLAGVREDRQVAEHDHVGIRHGGAEHIDKALGLDDLVAAHLERAAIVRAHLGVVGNQQDPGHASGGGAHGSLIIYRCALAPVRSFGPVTPSVRRAAPSTPSPARPARGREKMTG